MSIEKLERVMWRLRKLADGTRNPVNSLLEKAIMYECGTSRKTYTDNRRALIKLGWIKSHNTKRIRITDRDLTG